MKCCDIKAVKIRRNYENKGYHGWFDKRFMYEESLRMPLVVRYPERIESGSVSENIVSNLDFAPTFLELTGVEIPTEMQGAHSKICSSMKNPRNGANLFITTTMNTLPFTWPNATTV